jgi:hypothetical protein
MSGGSTTTITRHRTMQHLVLDIRKNWQRTAELHQKFNVECLRLACDLHEARARVEAGEEGDVTWWQCFAKNFPQSRSDAERLLAIASAANPQAAYEAEKARNTVYNQAYRARQRQRLHLTEMEPPPEAQSEVLPPSPDEEDLIDQIVDLFKRLPRSSQVRCTIRLRKVFRGEA